MWFRHSLITSTLGRVAPAILILSTVPGGHAQPKTFELSLTWEKHAPDGFERDMVLTNGQFPGPLLEMSHGDEVQVTVHNKMPFNTTVHYHGR